MSKQTTKAPPDCAPTNGSGTVTGDGYRRELRNETPTMILAWCYGELIQKWEQHWAEWRNPGPWKHSSIQVWRRLPELKDGQLVWPNANGESSNPPPK